MRHLLLHAAGNIRTRSVRLLQLQDIVLLSSRLGASDWDRLLEEGVDARGLWWALPPLTLTARYFPAAIPPRVIERLAAGCPLLLRLSSRRHCLADVSMSQIRIQAFPGLEWSRSPAEALHFIVSRVLPDRESRAQLRHHVATLPTLSGAPWYRLSHAGRILRWVLFQPPRVQTLYSVRRALAYRPA